MTKTARDRKTAAKDGNMDTEVIRSRRKTLALQIRDGRVTVRAPLRATDREIRAFVEKHRTWIETHLAKAQARELMKQNVRKLTDAEIRELKEQAKRVIPERVRYYAPLIGVTPGRITIRCQKTRWGSCSSKGALSFNCLLMLTPEEVADSIVVHELCHLKHMNHSARFYAEVQRVCPDYRKQQKWLKEHGELIIAMAEETTGEDGR